MIKLTAEEAVQRFFKGYLAWLKHGAFTSSPVFSRGAGLCLNLDNWVHAWREQRGTIDGYSSEVLVNGFRRERLNPDTPFNVNFNAHFAECSHSACHLNEARIAYVERHIK